MRRLIAHPELVALIISEALLETLCVVLSAFRKAIDDGVNVAIDQMGDLLAHLCLLVSNIRIAQDNLKQFI